MKKISKQKLNKRNKIKKYTQKYFGITPMDEQISARQSKFYFKYSASESAVCHAISKLR